MADYNDKVKALLGSDVIPEPSINRNNVYEQLYTVSGRTIICPSEMASSAGVEEDNCTETLRFRIPRFWDGNDLAQHVGKILFINAAGESDEYQIEDAEVNDTCIVFEWCLDSRVTKASGDVNFAIRFETINADTSEIVFRWTTLPCQMKISAGLAWSDSQIEATYPTILEQWLQRMTDCEANVNDLLENAGSKITDVTEATEKANTAAKNAEDATKAATTATDNANAATTAAKSATDAANKAATDATTVTANANASINATKDAAIEDISAAKDAAVTAATNATNATKTANDAATAANTATKNANDATTAATTATTNANAATEKANNFKYVGYWKEGFEYKANNLVRRIRDGITRLYICYIDHTSSAETDPAITVSRFLEIGSDGATGAKGEQGIQGQQGEKGDTGDRGLSAYEVAVANGFEGNTAAWLASLVGAKGEKGDTGATGAKGEQGVQGIQGIQGLSAFQVAAANGYDGTVTEWLASLKGQQGEKGETGATGATGATGEAGKTNYQLAVENGFEGSVSDWLESMKGAKGDTPVIGVDYYTTEQQAALAEQIKTLVLEDVDSQLDDINGGSSGGGGSTTVEEITVDTTQTGYTGEKWYYLVDEDFCTNVYMMGSTDWYVEGNTITSPSNFNGEQVEISINGESLNGYVVTAIEVSESTNTATATLTSTNKVYKIICKRDPDFA